MPPLPDLHAAHLAELFSALSDASRVKIIAALLEGPHNVQSLAEIAGISESAVSHHMRTLRQMRLARPHKTGRQVFYSLDDEHVADLFRRALEHISE
jgi:ArsR family transcriptional regulator, lead/cadmium/zinc/bismuth-responsive transcriptional repressor